MRPLLALSLALCAVASATSCARPVVAGVADAGAATIVLERRPCYGTCPVYTAALFDDGTVLFDGRNFVRMSGRQTARIAKRDVGDLVARLVGAGFPALAGSYIAGSPGCGNYATDAPTVVVTLRLGSVNKTVEHDHGCANAPAVLNAFEQAIDSVAQTRRWITP